MATGVDRRARFLGRRPESFRRSFLAAAVGVLMGSGIGCSVSTLDSGILIRSPSSNTMSSCRDSAGDPGVRASTFSLELSLSGEIGVAQDSLDAFLAPGDSGGAGAGNSVI